METKPGKKSKSWEIHVVKEDQSKNGGYRVVKLVNVLRVQDVGDVDVGMVLTRGDLQKAIQQGIRVVINEEREQR